MRQAGVLAAAGIIAITEHPALLQQDHDNARHLAEHLSGVPGLDVNVDAVQTNMVFAAVDEQFHKGFIDRMAAEGVLLQGSPAALRLVTHFDFKAEHIDSTVAAFARVLGTS